ncbi:MAG TPA: hypothetical protein VIL30_23050, partial [Ramlibacter sp.]
MPAISLLPAETAAARLVVALAGSEWLEFDAVLAPTLNLRIAPGGQGFPARGTVSIRRGPDHTDAGERIADVLRYIESCSDEDTGEHVQERFGVTLFLAEPAFDRLVARAHWGLPALVLSFDASSQVITHDAAGGLDDL